MELNYIELSDEQWDAYLGVALAETFSKPGAADVSPEDKKKLKGILAHYAKMAHPFTACKRDQIKHGLSEEHANRRCAVIKDIIRGTTKWRGKAEGKADTALASLDLLDLDPDEVIALANTRYPKTRREGDVNVSNHAGLRAGAGTTTTTGATTTAVSGTNAPHTISIATTNDYRGQSHGHGQPEEVAVEVASLALKVGDVVEWGKEGEADAKGYGLVTEVDTTNQQVRVVPLEPGPNGALSKSGEDAVMKDIDNVRASGKRLTESVAWPKKAQENAVLGMWMARDHGETVPGVAVDMAEGKVLEEDQLDEVADFFLSVCSDDDPTFDCSWAEYQMYGGDAGREWITQLSEISEAMDAASGNKNDSSTYSDKFSPGDKVQWKGSDGKTVTGTIVRVLKKDGTPMCLVRTSDGGTVTVSHSSLSRATSGSSGSSDNEGQEGDLAFTYPIAAAQMPVDMSEVIDLGGNVWKKHILPYGKIHYKGRTLDFSKNFAKKLVENFKRKPFDSVPFINVDGHNQHNSDPERVRGEVTNLELGEDGVYARVETNEKGTEYLKTVNPKLGSSVRVRFDWKRPADNKYFGPVLEHLAGTTLPHVPGLKPFAPADLSLVEMSERPSMLSKHAPGAGGVEDLTACSFTALEPDSGESWREPRLEEGGDPVTPQDKPDNTKEVTNLTDANANANANSSETEGGKINPLDQIDLSQFPEEQRYAVAALVEAAQEREHEAKKAYDFAEQAMTAMKKQKQELHNERVKSYISDLADTGMVPAILKPIEALLSDQSLAGKEMTVDLSDDGSGAQTTDVHGLVKMIADNYPREMEYGEKGRTDLAEEDDDAAFEAMWEKYQQDHGIGLGTSSSAKGGE